MIDKNSIEYKILDWMSTEGYPLEFKTANIFRANHFNTFQGRYVNDFKTNIPREIDVIAQKTTDVGDSFLRISYVIECKRSEKNHGLFLRIRIPRYLRPLAFPSQLLQNL